MWLRFLKASRTIEAQLRENLRVEFASTLPRFDVMAALCRFEDGLKMSQLSGVLKVSNGNVTGIVDRLVDNGLVERRAVVGDRRAQLICLTSHGAATFADHARIHEGWVDELLADLPASDVEQLMDLLDLVITKEDLS